MRSKLLVPLDGSPAAAAALPAARTLAAALDAELHLVRAVSPPGLIPEEHADELSEAAAYLDGLARKLATTTLRVETSVPVGEPHEAILRELAERHFDLVVMATRGRRGLMRALMGSMASEIVSRSPVPVVLVRPESRPLSQIKHILVPVDGSTSGALALGAATRLAGASDAQVTVLEVVEPVLRGAAFVVGYVDPDLEKASLDNARRYVDDVAHRLRRRNISGQGLAIIGDIADTIARTAADRSADLIVMSTRARTGAARAVLGSVADAVMRSAETPVLLVPHGSASAAAVIGLHGDLVPSTGAQMNAQPKTDGRSVEAPPAGDTPGQHQPCTQDE